jgi:predicted permease
VTSGYFRVLGIQPERGREFEEKDELPGNDKVVILSDNLWRREFAAAPDIIGRKVTLDNEPFTVVGVMPPGTDHPGNEYQPLAYGDTVDAWWPFTFQGDPARRGAHYIEGIARLKPGVTPEQGQSELNTLMAQITREYPDMYKGWKILAIPLYRTIVGPSQRMLLVLLGAVALVLLIACANAANLMLARAASRQREIAVRTALGAPRWRLIRQTLTESIFIALLGGALGAALAAGCVKVLVALLPAGFPRADAIHLNGTVFAFTFLIAVGTGLLFGIAPALQSSRSDLQSNLREGGRGATGSVRHHRLRSALVVTEVSLACVLLVGAGLMLRSFVNLLRTDPGFQPEHVLTASILLPDADYKTSEAVVHFYDGLMTNLGSAPGVSSAGAGSDVPWTGYDDNSGFDIEGMKSQPGEEPHGRYHLASPDYFRALGISLVRGRYFTEADSKDAPATLIVNDAMARRYWPGIDAVGRRITFENSPKEKDWMTIVGIVADVKDRADSSHAEPAFWWPMLQQPFRSPKMSIVVRAKGDASELAAVVRDEVHKLDPTLAVADVRLMDSIADASVSTPRFTFFLIGLFAGLAIVLAAIGIYGVISYSVTQRAHELGLRVALGAQRWDVLRLVLSEGMRLAAGGVVLGVICALALARALRSLMYEVSSRDPLTFALVSLLVVAVALIACYLPARRATQADPVVALRSE